MRHYYAWYNRFGRIANTSPFGRVYYTSRMGDRLRGRRLGARHVHNVVTRYGLSHFHRLGELY